MLYALLFVSVALLIVVGAIRISRAGGSQFEIQRRADSGDDDAQQILSRDKIVPDLLSLQRAVVALLVIIVTMLSVAMYGWVIGIIIALVITLGYGIVSRQAYVHRFAQKRYDAFEPTLIVWIQKVPLLFAILRSVATEPAVDPELSSKQQLLHLIDSSQALFTNDQKLQIRSGLEFGDKLVSDHMTPRSVIDSVSASELLGPLVLDDLHKTGHSRFPVVDGDIDHVVGMLHIRDLLVLDSGKRTTTVHRAMESRVFYINETQTLAAALAAFLKSHHHLFVVVNEYRETVGLLSLEDVIEALLGRQIVDEFDAHEDLRSVAARNPRANNQPKQQTNV